MSNVRDVDTDLVLPSSDNLDAGNAEGLFMARNISQCPQVCESLSAEYFRRYFIMLMLPVALAEDTVLAKSRASIQLQIQVKQCIV